jgi:hypothetical protein
MPSQRPQYGNTVHLFIGTGHSPCKITLMPFTFINNSIVILQGLIWLFIFKSVSSSCRYTEALLHTASWLSYPSSWSPSQSSFVLTMFLYTRNLSSKVPVHIFLLENIVKLRFWGPSEAEGPQHLDHFYFVLVIKYSTHCVWTNIILYEQWVHVVKTNWEKALLGLEVGITQIHMVPSEKCKLQTLSKLFWVLIIFV